MKLLVTEKNINIFYNFLHFKTMFETLYIFKELEYITFNWITPRSQFNVLIDDINAILTQYMFNNDYTFKTFKYDHLVQLIDDDGGVMVSCDTYDTYENNMIECIAMMLLNTSDILELTLSYIRTYYKKEYELVNMIYSQLYSTFEYNAININSEILKHNDITTYKQYKDRDRKIKELIC